jgi:hypothetical protein
MQLTTYKASLLITLSIKKLHRNPLGSFKDQNVYSYRQRFIPCYNYDYDAQIWNLCYKTNIKPYKHGCTLRLSTGHDQPVGLTRVTWVRRRTPEEWPTVYTRSIYWLCGTCDCPLMFLWRFHHFSLYNWLLNKVNNTSFSARLLWLVMHLS